MNMVTKKKDIELGSDSRSLDRPAWTSEDLFAFNHKHRFNIKTREPLTENYYIRRQGLA